MSEQSNKESVSFLTALRSAFAGLLGVQSNANRERDFNSGKFWHFFMAGVIVTVLFLGAVGLVVKFMMMGT